MNTQIKDYQQEEDVRTELRKASQFLMPSKLDAAFNANGGYNIYPTRALGSGKIFNGFDTLAQYIIEQKKVVIDGFVGVFWNRVQTELQACFDKAGLSVNWINTATYLKPVDEVEELVKPFLGESQSVWGTKTNLSLKDIYTDNLTKQVADASDINIVIGTGAVLSGWDAAIIYIDLPKNELQYRMRAGGITNLGAVDIIEDFRMYKRYYFVDWVMLNNHKKEILNNIAVVADGQWLDTINWMYKTDLADGLNKISKSVIRVRPWVEPGIWGGQWIKKNIDNLNKDVDNLAWSFELIVPENGLVFESDGNLLEVSFDTLMFACGQNILGKHAERFGDQFPIRFNFLDTFDGGNLSIQCHPSLKYIQENFGEKHTQNETYYILDCENDAIVYLGFNENIDPEEFRNILEESYTSATKVDVEKYVQTHVAEKHGLYLIPNSTIHSSGTGNMVLEISATQYIFTFKMYDWLSLDQNGKPRPINIDHAFNNLDFTRKGEVVKQQLISKPQVIEETADYTLIHLPTHAEHYYDVHRIEFDSKATVKTNDMVHVMMLVEGQAILLETADGTTQRFAYAETFVVPAAAGGYTLTNLGEGRAKVVKAFLK